MLDNFRCKIKASNVRKNKKNLPGEVVTVQKGLWRCKWQTVFFPPSVKREVWSF